MSITRRDMLEGSIAFGALAIAAPSGATESARKLPAPQSPPVLVLVEGNINDYPDTPRNAAEYWQVSSSEPLDFPALSARLQQCHGRVIGYLRSANHVLLMEAVRSGGGSVVRDSLLPLELRAMRPAPSSAMIHVLIATMG